MNNVLDIFGFLAKSWRFCLKLKILIIGGFELKEKIHPEYHKVKAVCACGETFETRSTRKGIRVDICSKCHPFFTGKQKILDAEGRVERFKKKYANK